MASLSKSKPNTVTKEKVYGFLTPRISLFGIYYNFSTKVKKQGVYTFFSGQNFEVDQGAVGVDNA